mmetsp:Transcript_3897/g.11048  ORF Transcript_3897/g.11048 Transcript_3897/m.11048 type:complete len:217 (-) Transcript_3897:859-1509(-)
MSSGSTPLRGGSMTTTSAPFKVVNGSQPADMTFSSSTGSCPPEPRLACSIRSFAIRYGSKVVGFTSTPVTEAHAREAASDSPMQPTPAWNSTTAAPSGTHCCMRDKQMSMVAKFTWAKLPGLKHTSAPAKCCQRYLSPWRSSHSRPRMRFPRVTLKLAQTECRRGAVPAGPLLTCHSAAARLSRECTDPELPFSNSSGGQFQTRATWTLAKGSCCA